jgi:sphinganine-1-phosphate aldolase
MPERATAGKPMRFPAHGLSPEQIESALDGMRTDDADWSAGRTWSLVYSAGPEHEAVLRDAYLRFFNENGLSPTAFPSLARMEREVVWALLDLLGADPDRAGGTMASGGTESIILAVKAYRDASDVAHPRMVVPSTAHPAFVKAGRLLRVEPVVVPVGQDLVADVHATAAALDEDTILLAASAPGFPYGLVDPIVDLATLAREHGIGLHIDACLGGFALPFLRSVGHEVPPFDFSVEGVSSISADLHKYGYGPKGTSTVLYADRQLRRSQFTADTRWPGGAFASPTLLGTRPGGAIAAAWAALHHLGFDGYQRLFASLLDTTKRLQHGIRAIGDLQIVGDPPMTVFAFGSAGRDVFAMADRLERHGWRIDRQHDPDCLHLIVNPVHARVVDPFLADLAEAYDSAPAAGGPRSDAVLYGVTAHVPVDGDLEQTILHQIEQVYDTDSTAAAPAGSTPSDLVGRRPAHEVPSSVTDGSLAAAVLGSRTPSHAVPAALIEACSLPEIGSRLGYLSVRLDTDQERPFHLDGSVVTMRPDVAADLGSAALALREAIELVALGGGRRLWPDRIVAHAIAVAYAATALVRRLPAGAQPVPGLSASDVSVESLHAEPRRAATSIARLLEARDATGGTCPDTAIDAASRALPLALPTQVLLTTGGDDRQKVDWQRGVNAYGIAPRPTPWTVAFGSCTASSPTYRGFDAAAQLKYRLIEGALAGRLDEAVGAETERIRRTLLDALGVAPDQGVEVVLTPSGTDAELVALAVALAAGEPVQTIVVGPNELGRGTVPAATGHHFSTSLPSGRSVDRGDEVQGIPSEKVSLVEIPTRDDHGALLPADAVEDAIDAALSAAPSHVLLHVVEGSKTGIRLPRTGSVQRWQEREGDRLDVVVDAAQMRIDRHTVVDHLERGRMIFVTGSKFFGGPPFSGAILLPSALADRVRAAPHLPAGLSDYLTRADVPDSLAPLRAGARADVNFGLLARWAAALAEMRSFHNASEEIRDEVLRVLVAGLRELLIAAPHVVIVESPYTPIPEHDQRTLDDLPTIFTFLVRHPSGGFLTLEQAEVAHRLLAQDARSRLEADGDPHHTASRSFHLGQPVKIAREGDGWLAGLRFAIGAPTISQVVFDHTRGERWTDRVGRELADIKDALAKLALIVERVDLDAPA